MAICKKCQRPFSDQEAYAGFTYCEHCETTSCTTHNAQESKAVRWVLHSAVEDARDWKKNLTDEEIEYCLSKESRVTVRKMLEAEKRKRSRTRA